MTRPAVFLSYAHPDRETADAIVASVEEQGIRCWVAPRDVTPGADWAEEIVAAIAAVRVMVLVFSARANASPQVRREVERAVHRGVALLPVRVEDTLPTGSLEYFLSSQHWLDAFPPPLAPHYARLGAQLKALLSREPVRPASPEPARATAAAATQFATSAPVRHVTPGAGADGAILRWLESELADYVGPLARHLVKRAARSASGIESLVLRLAEEIEPEGARRKFIENSLRALRKSA